MARNKKSSSKYWGDWEGGVVESAAKSKPKKKKPRKPKFPLLEAITDEDFGAKLETEPVFVIDFTASWCIPCESFAPVLEEANHLWEGGQIYKADIDQDMPTVSKQLGISSVPTLVFYKGGKEVFRTTGAKGLDTIIAHLEEHFA